MKNGAKYFKGTIETNKAEAWTLNVLKTFKVMELPENHWIRLTSFMFEEKAAFQWEAAQRSTFARCEFRTITWPEFTDAFNITYYLEQVREQKAWRFYTIQQCNLWAREFKQKFIQLELFVPGYMHY